MSLFSNVESGTKLFRSRFSKSISFEKDYDCRFGELIPVLAKFVLPGDIWRIGADVLIRFQPMLTPTLTPNCMKVRYFFVPLRLIEPNTELIITGSQDGQLYESTLPKFNNFVADANKVAYSDAYKVKKYSFWDYMGIPCMDYEAIKTNECLPAAYWQKGFVRCIWDYYRDENLSYIHAQYKEFESYWTSLKAHGADFEPPFAELPKDYFTSSLPWQLKGTAPTILMNGTISLTPDFGETRDTGVYAYNKLIEAHASTTPFGSYGTSGQSSQYYDFSQPSGETDTSYKPGFGLWYDANVSGSNEAARKAMVNATKDGMSKIFKNMTASSNMGFNADDFRTMMAETRIFERLARCGSRYTEYLHSNFGLAPADGTLQRAQYLGGFKIPIVVSEVLQTAEDGTSPVGTMRGHGISRGGNRINTFMAKEFGLIFGIAHVMPKILYTQGIDKEFTYKSRFDFFNPSFQHLSEQEVRNGEIFVSNSDGKNDDTFGFQAYANELRTSMSKVVGDLRGSIAYWTQALQFGSRPNLNSALINSSSHMASFNAPFGYSDTTGRPCIVQFYNNLDVYRPMVRYSTPGLVDHL